MTTPNRTAELLRRMLERRARLARAWWLARGRGEKLILAASAAILLVGFPLTAILAGGLLTPQPKPRGPADVLLPSSSAVVPTATASSLAPTSSLTPTGIPSQPLASLPPAWALPPGWRYELVCDDRDTRCSLHLFDEAGGEQDGWPAAIAGECLGDAVAVGPENALFVACMGNGSVIVSGLNRRGDALAGWPVKVRGDLAYNVWNDFQLSGGVPWIEVGPDGTVFVSVKSPGRGKFAIHALAPDGSGRSGWPVELAGGAQGYTVAPDGTVVAWWYEDALAEIVLEARRTVFTMIDPKGRTLPGWPRGSVGAASGPIVWRDGSIYYVSASGKVWGHDRTGEIIGGWPYALPEPIAPGLRDDGSLIFFADSRVIVLDRHGRDVPGWPYRTKGTLMGPSCDTPGWPYPVKATASNGTLVIAPWDGTNATVVALDLDGEPVDGWPYRVPTGWRVTELDVDSDGTVRASLSSDWCGGGFDATSIRLTHDGSLVGDPPATPLSVVYQALRLDGLRTSTGQTVYSQGSSVDFEFGLVNRSSETVRLPHVDYNGESYYAAGTLQTWIERLGSRSDIDCLPGAGRKDAWYATGGWINVATDPVSILPGGGMPTTLQGSLWPDLTGCLPPGDYRYHVEYKPLAAGDEDVIDDRTVDFGIISASTPTPTPTPPSADPGRTSPVSSAASPGP